MNSKVSMAPICLFTFNRPDHTRRTVEALLANPEAEISELYVFCDGPRNPAEENAVAEVRSYLRSLHGFKRVSTEFQSTNLGLAQSIIQGVTKVVNQHGKVIVVEDDLVTSPYFLRYMNDALEKYRDQHQVISIHAYSYPTLKPLPETFFLRGADCWGWATWKRGWDLFESDGQKLLRQLTERNLLSEFNFSHTYPYSQMLKNQIAGRNNSWAIRWYASAFLANKFTLYPGRSLVTNIGLDGSGTHCADDDTAFTEASKEPVPLDEIPIEDSKVARQIFTEYFANQNPSFPQRVRNKVKRWFAPF